MGQFRNQTINEAPCIGVIGLGVIGGSYVEGLSNKGLECYGFDIDEKAVAYAYDKHWIYNDKSDLKLLEKCNIVICALYPKAMLEWLDENQHLLKKNCILLDVTGVKRNIVDKVNNMLREDIEYVSCHPMAGRESKGIEFADVSRFQNANFIVINNRNSRKGLELAFSIADALGFKNISTLTSEEHDKMIGYLSQLTHVIAISLMNMSDNEHLVKYTGDSFRDLTRIAKINEDMWPELFIENKDYLMEEIDCFIKELNDIKKDINDEDVDSLKAKMISSTNKRKKFDI